MSVSYDGTSDGNNLTVLVILEDINDNNPVFKESNLTFIVDDSISSGQTIASVRSKADSYY